MKVAVIVWDGLRPEFIQPDLTPSLWDLSENGFCFRNHSAVYPTETRVNSASIATGMHPAGHGIVANRFLDRPSGLVVNTGDHLQLDQLGDSAGAILPFPTICGHIRGHGMRSLVVGSGSPGSTLLQDPVNQDRFVNVRGLVSPEAARDDFARDYGPFPEEADPPDAWNDLACKVFSDGLEDGFDFGLLWLCDPDFTQHKHGLGSPKSLAAIKANDGRLASLREVLPLGVDLLVLSDHGFSTIDSETRQDPSWIGLPDDAYIAGSSGIYLVDPARDLEGTTHKLLQQEWAGPVFLRESIDRAESPFTQTFSQQLLRIEHPDRAPDIAFSRKWSSRANIYGVKGFSQGSGGIATHGTLSPHDMQAVLVGDGPSFKSGQSSNLPTSAVDIAPTVLELMGLEGKLDGRVVREGLIKGPEAADMEVILREVANDQIAFTFHTVEGREYLVDVSTP